ncbi:MAG: ImmA/IrrE family metallo-endopeptidase [Acidimicrobiales bacterium]
MNPSIITKLRDTVPLRPLRYSEALRLAELQAQRFLAIAGITEPSVPERIITDLPYVQVTHMSPFPSSGASHWSRGRWLVILNASEPATRQRFSLAHEAKHIIDHRFVKLMYSTFPDSERRDMVERICDYFAGCLLMPRPWVKRIYCSGVQLLPDLAQVFGVSQAAISVRLSQIGLVDPTPRCLPASDGWTFRDVERPGSRTTYQRFASYVT